MFKFLAAVFFLGGLTFFFGCNGVFYQPSKKQFDDPKNYNFVVDEHWITSTHNIKLHAQTIKSIHHDSIKALAIIFHGNAQNLSSHFNNFKWLINSGVDVLIFDYSGYGHSEGSPSRQQVQEDGLSVLNWVDTTLLKEYDKLILIGQSLGGAVLVSSLAEWRHKNKADLLILDSSFLSYRAAARDVVSKYWLTWPLQALVPVLISENKSPLYAVDSLKSIKKMVLHCRADIVVSYKLGFKLYESLSEPKEFIVEEKCRHIGIFSIATVRNHLLQEIEKL